MLKKLISLVLIIGLCSLVGCGNSNNVKQQSNESNQTQSTPAPTESKYQIGLDGSFEVNELKKIQLIGVGNEKEEPFLVKKIESNASHITIFTLEDGSIRVVNCEFKEVK